LGFAGLLCHEKQNQHREGKQPLMLAE
jgi:hypothetical protein